MKPKCEHPNIIFNPHLKWLYCTRAIAFYVKGVIRDIIHSPRDYYNFPWRMFWTFKAEVTLDSIEEYFLYDADDNCYPIFMAVPCGKCRLCLDAKVESWVTRCLCESNTSKYPPLFITLTYDRQHLPSDGVSKRDVQLFLKRLRSDVEYSLGEKTSLRYFLCAEYGKKTHRAHYHMLLWNMPYVSMCEGDPNSFYALWRFIRENWANGNIRVEYCRDKAGRYCFKYMRKECNTPRGFNETFYLASRRPGLGFAWLKEHYKEYADVLESQCLFIRSVDKDGQSKIDKRPIPQYFKRKLWPTVSLLFPTDVSKAVKDFMSEATKQFYFQSVMYNNTSLTADILRMVDKVRAKYGSIFPVDFDAAYPSKSWVVKVNTYHHIRDANGQFCPCDVRRIHNDVIPILYYDADDNVSLAPYSHEVVSAGDGIIVGYTPDYLNSDYNCFLMRKEFIHSYRSMKDAYKILMSHKFDQQKILDLLSRTSFHKETLRVLNEYKDDPDIDSLIHKYEVDRRWERTHWLEVEV